MIEASKLADEAEPASIDSAEGEPRSSVGEDLDAELARLRDAAIAKHVSLPALLGRIVADLRHEPPEDDTAIVGLRWKD